MRWINRSPSRPLALALTLAPFAVLALVYMSASEARLAINPADKLLPSPATLAETAQRLLTVPDRRSGRLLFWDDTAASLWRLAQGAAIAASLGLVTGIAIGLLPVVRAAFAGFVSVVSLIPPLAVLPVLFIVFGLGETSKVALIAIGITPFLIRDLAGRTAELPAEQLVKAQTLGAASLAIALRVVLPQIMPRLLGSLRLALGPAWLFLIAAEAIASENGLGYRIFLVRRYLAMDVILVYVAWITLLAFLLDLALRQLQRRLYPWSEAGV